MRFIVHIWSLSQDTNDIDAKHTTPRMATTSPAALPPVAPIWAVTSAGGRANNKAPAMSKTIDIIAKNIDISFLS
jgi:hypothetical protein